MLPDSVKSFSLKDWVYVVGLIVSIAMAWAVLNSKVDQLKVDAHASVIRQQIKDQEQDTNTKEIATEIKQSIKEQTAELKAELKDIRREIKEIPRK